MEHYGQAANNAIASERELTFTERMSNQLGALNSELGDAYSRLEKLYSVRFGSRPQPAADPAAKLQAVPTCSTGEMLDAAALAMGRAYGLSGLISDLERAL